jgi:hypothetical protein
LASLVLAMAGVLISHTLGYGVAHLDAADRAEALRDHAYLVILSWLVVPAALAVVGWLAVRAVRAAGSGVGITTGRLTVSMWALLAVQEVGERVASGGVGDVAHEPGVWWSAGLVVLVAWILVGLVSSTAWVADRLRRRDPDPVPAPAVWPLRASLVLAAGPLPSPVLARAPPLSFLS